MSATTRHEAALKLVTFANQFAELGAYRDALGLYRRAAEIGVNIAQFYFLLGSAFEALVAYDDAIASYRRAVELQPTYHAAFNNLGNALHASGRADEAVEAFKTAIRLAPNIGSYYRNLVQAKRIAADDPLLSTMQALIADEGATTPEDRVQLQFALGLALTEAGQGARGFEHLLKGNASYRERSHYDEKAALDRLAGIQRMFTREVINRRAGEGDPSAVPIFIVGMPRSGSTLVEQILASHPHVVAGGERLDFSRAFSQTVEKSKAQAGGGGNGAQPVSSPDAPANELDSLSPATVREIGSAYVTRLRNAAPQDRPWLRMTDKLPFNFELVGLIHLALPNARFVYTRRAPVETCLSCFARIFKDVPFSYDLGELGRFYRAYEELREHWHDVLPPGTMLEVSYEDLVEDVEREARRIVAHCGLEWDDACLNFHQTARPVVTASATQVRQPIYRTSLVYERPEPGLLKPLLDALGSNAQDAGLA
jgi:tetratricopeptide (TPR) repeat protein